MAKTLTALFGGTFDPIHYGHLIPVMSLAKEVGLSQVSLLPNHIPPHKQHLDTTPEQRIDMLKLAINHNPLFTIDTRELNRDKPSYTIDTLYEWRQEHNKKDGLAFIIGQDSLLNINHWHRWQELLDFCHLLVCQRPGFQSQSENISLQQWIERHQTTNIQLLHSNPNGYIYLANTPLEAISATEIRQRLAHHQDCSQLLPSAVLDYIEKNRLYTQSK